MAPPEKHEPNIFVEYVIRRTSLFFSVEQRSQITKAVDKMIVAAGEQNLTEPSLIDNKCSGVQSWGGVRTARCAEVMMPAKTVCRL